MSESGYFAPRGHTAQEEMRVLPEFQVVPLEGTRKKKVYNYETVVEKEDEKTGGTKKFRRRVEKEVEEPAGYMVYFPKKGSVRLSEAELKAHKLHRRPGLVDLETGEKITQQPMYDLAALEDSEQELRASRRKR